MLQHILKIVAIALCLCGFLSAAEASGIWLDVPFVNQQKNGCGAAVVAMVMQYWAQHDGRPVTETANAAFIQNALHSGEARGIYASAMVRFLR